MTPDNKWVLTAGDDGCLFATELEPVGGGGIMPASSAGHSSMGGASSSRPAGSPWSEEGEIAVLLRSDLLALEKKAAELEAGLRTAIAAHDYEARVREGVLQSQSAALREQLRATQADLAGRREEIHALQSAVARTAADAKAGAASLLLAQSHADEERAQRLLELEREAAAKAVAEAESRRVKAEAASEKALAAAREQASAVARSLSSQLASVSEKLLLTERGAEARARADKAARMMAEEEAEAEVARGEEQTAAAVQEERRQMDLRLARATLRAESMAKKIEEAEQAFEKLKVKEMEIARLVAEREDLRYTVQLMRQHEEDRRQQASCGKRTRASPPVGGHSLL